MVVPQGPVPRPNNFLININDLIYLSPKFNWIELIYFHIQKKTFNNLTLSKQQVEDFLVIINSYNVHDFCFYSFIFNYYFSCVNLLLMIFDLC